MELLYTGSLLKSGVPLPKPIAFGSIGGKKVGSKSKNNVELHSNSNNNGSSGDAATNGEHHSQHKKKKEVIPTTDEKVVRRTGKRRRRKPAMEARAGIFFTTL